MKKFILDLNVVENKTLNDQYYLLILTSEKLLPPMQPGQFVEVKIEDTSKTFLRRPISVNFVDYQKNELWLLIQKVGEGTRKLSTLKKGDDLNIILPLGNTFTLPSNKNAKILMIGGGVGIAPLLFLGYQLKSQGFTANFLLGGRSNSNIIEFDHFSAIGKVFITTEDGSFGEKGFVTNHSVLDQEFDYIYTCGPTPMMKAVASYASKKNINCEVSLENTMACGFGVCLCCVTETTTGNQCVCTDGPVFNITDLKWQI